MSVQETGYIPNREEVQTLGTKALEELKAARAADIAVDMVNHPPHYTSDPSGVECIQITRHRNFNIGNAIKYLWRAGLKVSSDIKAKQIEDLQKAIFYIQDEIKRLQGLTDA